LILYLNNTYKLFLKNINRIHTTYNYTSVNQLRYFSDVNFKKIIRKKILSRSSLPFVTNVNSIKYLNPQKSSLNSLSRLLKLYFNNFFLKKINFILNYTHSKNITKDTRNIKHFYYKSMLNKKSGYSRIFSRVNKPKIFVTFKHFNGYSQLSGNLRRLDFTSSNVNSIFYVTILFNIFLSPFFSNFYSKTVLNYFQSSDFTSHLLNNSRISYNATSPNFMNYLVFKSLVINQHLSINLNSKHKNIRFLKDVSSLYVVNNLLLQKTINRVNFQDNISSNSIIWSNFWNTLFMSNTRNMSAHSLFMSISSSDQDYFLSSKSFFADYNFGNYYINYVPFQCSLIPSQTGLLFLTLKSNSSFFNNLKWRKSSTMSNLSTRMDIFLNTIDNDFSCLYNENTDNSIFKLSSLKSSLHSLHGNNTSFLKHILYRKKSIITLKNNFYRSTSFFNSFNSNFKKLLISSTLPFDDDFQDIPRFRHKMINKNLFFFGNTESSVSEVKIKNVEHEEAFYKTHDKNNFIQNSKHKFLESSQTYISTYVSLNKMSDFLSLISSPLYLKLNLKTLIFSKKSAYSTRFIYTMINTLFIKYFSKIDKNVSKNCLNNNLIPNSNFSFSIFKKISGSFADGVFTMSSTPWHYNSIIRFMEFCSGRKVLFQFYPFLAQSIEKYYVVTYKRWMTRMTYYERKLGHKFFLEEALHLMHLTLNLHDPKVMCTWLKAIIQRISFWKTRSIFRFLKYLFSQYFNIIMNEIGSKGLKICLRGKISAAGNSRTRTILYRTGQTSHANTSLKVLNEFMTIGTFTGVMGLQIWIFY